MQLEEVHYLEWGAFRQLYDARAAGFPLISFRWLLGFALREPAEDSNGDVAIDNLSFVVKHIVAFVQNGGTTLCYG